MTEELKSASYKECSCGCDCYALGISDKLCWGDVQAIDEFSSEDEFGYVHACMGHTSEYEGNSYLEENAL